MATSEEARAAEVALARLDKELAQLKAERFKIRASMCREMVGEACAFAVLVALMYYIFHNWKMSDDWYDIGSLDIAFALCLAVACALWLMVIHGTRQARSERREQELDEKKWKIVDIEEEINRARKGDR